MASLGLGWVGQPVFVELLSPLLLSLHVESEALRHSISFAVGFSALTFLHISAGELAPKWAAIQNPLPISLWVAQPLKWFYLASYPFNWLLNQAARWLLRQAGIAMAGEGGARIPKRNCACLRRRRKSSPAVVRWAETSC